MYKVILPGEVLIDKVMFGNSVSENVGGAPANVAYAISQQNPHAYFIGTHGNDEYGKFIIDKFNQYNLPSQGLIKKNLPTTIANITSDEGGEGSFTFERGADAKLDYHEIPKSVLNNFDLLHLGSATAFLGDELLKTYYELLNIAFNNKKIIVFDPNYRSNLYKTKINRFRKNSLKVFEKATIVKLSYDELTLITASNTLEQAVSKVASYGPKVILVTLGSKGTYLYTKSVAKTISSIKVKQIDSTGAGDSFIGSFIGQLSNLNVNLDNLDELDLEKLVQKSNISAALTVIKPGAFSAIPKWSEVEKVFKENFNEA